MKLNVILGIDGFHNGLRAISEMECDEKIWDASGYGTQESGVVYLSSCHRDAAGESVRTIQRRGTWSAVVGLYSTEGIILLNSLIKNYSGAERVQLRAWTQNVRRPTDQIIELDLLFLVFLYRVVSITTALFSVVVIY